MKKTLSLIALLLFAPAPTVGVLLALHSPQGGASGTILWIAAKVWLFVLPAMWYLFIEKQPFSLSKPKQGGVFIAFIVGIIMFAVILAAFGLMHNTLSPDLIRQKAATFGLNRPLIYLAAAFYWIAINSLLEEYIFRFFFYRQLENIFNIKWLAVILAATIFTLHHSVVLSAYLPIMHNILASLGIFGAGVIWSGLYAKYRSVWIPFISHAFADIAVFGIGAYLIFQAA